MNFQSPPIKSAGRLSIFQSKQTHLWYSRQVNNNNTPMVNDRPSASAPERRPASQEWLFPLVIYFNGSVWQGLYANGSAWANVQYLKCKWKTTAPFLQRTWNVWQMTSSYPLDLPVRWCVLGYHSLSIHLTPCKNISTSFLADI